MEELKRGVAVFVAAVVLTTGSPAMAQSSGLLASVERAVLTMEVEQDETVVRRRRSGGLALTGGSLAVAGVVLALRPPVCELRGRPPSYPAGRTYEAALYMGQCDVKATSPAYGGIDYRSVHGDLIAWEDNDLSSVRNKTWNYVGWATAAAGGAMMLFGLRGVEVPVRLDVAPTGGFRVARSLGW